MRPMARCATVFALVFTLAGAAPASAAAPRALPGALPPAAAEAFRSLRPDPPPERLTLDAHFIVSDEKAHHVFRDLVADKGGVLVGLGTDQVYLLSGWARPDVIVALDFDQYVVDLHQVYRALFLAAPSPAAFEALWQKEAEAQVAAAIDAIEPDAKRAKWLKKVWARTLKRVQQRFRTVHRVQRQAGIPWYLSDADQYAWIRGLCQAGRVFAVRGDLLKDQAMRDVAAATRAAGLTVRVLYLSNAERYFRYNDDFAENVLALPFDEESMVVRTGGVSTLGADTADGHYLYYAMKGLDFRAWFDGRRRPANVYSVLQKPQPDERWKGLYHNGPPPPPKPKKPRR